MTSWN